MGLISNGSTVFDNGSMSSGFGGSLVFIKKLTASSSATLSFVDGSDGVVLDDTYKEYYFTFNNIHPASDNVNLQFNMSSDGGSNYNITKTTTQFRASHGEDDGGAVLEYRSGEDLAQSTSFQSLIDSTGNDNDQSTSGTLRIFNPSSTTFVKHFISNMNGYRQNDQTTNVYVAGYGNTTSAVDGVQFKMSSGNIDAGDICLYGIA
jgi:hypothetical protein